MPYMKYATLIKLVKGAKTGGKCYFYLDTGVRYHTAGFRFRTIKN
jgi:hypothetical protein